MSGVLDRHWKICFEDELADSLDDGWQLEDRWISTTISFDERQDYSYKFLLYKDEIRHYGRYPWKTEADTNDSED